MKAITFDILVDRIVEREKSFGKKESLSNSTVESLCLAHKEKKPRGESARFKHSNRGHGRRPFRGRGVIIIKEIDNKMINNKNIFRMINNLLSAIGVVNWVIPLLIVALLGKGLVRRKRNNLQTKENHLNLPTILLHIVILVSMKFLRLLLLLGKTLEF